MTNSESHELLHRYCYTFHQCFWLLIIALFVGCGKSEFVPAIGKLKIEGEAASAGRIMFVPVGEGSRADSLVFDDGGFALRTKGDSGAVPGAYRVIFRTDLATAKEASKAIGLKNMPQDMVVVYQSPNKKPITIPPEGIENLEVNIDGKQGWTRKLSD